MMSQKVFQGRLHRRRRPLGQEQIVFRKLTTVVGFAALDGEPQGQGAEARQQHHETDQRPDQNRHRQPIVDQGLGGPVVRGRDLRSRPVRRTGPGNSTKRKLLSCANR